MDGVVVDLVQRDDFIRCGLVGREPGRFTVEELKSAIQAQRKVERDFLSGAVSGSFPKCFIPGLRI